MRLECEIRIRARPEAVFHWIDDPERAMRWMADVRSTEVLHRTPGLTGTRFREWVGGKGRLSCLEGVVTCFTPGERIAFHLEGPVNDVEVGYLAEPDGQGTRLRVRAVVRFKSTMRLLERSCGGLLERLLRRQTLGELGKLKKLCEGPEGGRNQAIMGADKK